jgi:hypothetical protein
MKAIKHKGASPKDVVVHSALEVNSLKRSYNAYES